MKKAHSSSFLLLIAIFVESDSKKWMEYQMNSLNDSADLRGRGWGAYSFEAQILNIY